MKTLFLLFAGLLFASPFLPAVPAAHAQDVLTSSCAAAMYDSLATEQRMFRSVLYGEKAARDLKAGSVKFDKQGLSWIKTNRNEWKTLGKDGENPTHGDEAMDDTSDVPPRRGIVERREAVTSDYLPDILQAVRAFQCRLHARCQVAVESQADGGLETITVQPPGCIAMTFDRLKACSLSNNVSDVSVGACQEAASAIVSRELSLLEMTVTYDAAYRSLHQFAGIFEGFLHDFRLPLLEPLRQTVDVLSGFQNIPCFQSQCDE